MTNLEKHLWIFKSKGEESSFGGNLGYADKPSSHYIYNTTVNNYKKVNIGDSILVVSKEFILGYAIITTIDIQKGIQKTRYRCPVCNIAEHYKRENISPKYKCRNKHEFDKPAEQNIIVDEFTASYASTFKALPKNTSVKLLDEYYINRNRYYSIQGASFDFLYDKFPYLVKLINKIEFSEKAAWGKKNVSNISLYVPKDKDERESKFGKRISRIGQTKFKSDLIDIYGPVCMITQVFIPITIQASHILPYRGIKDNNERNGLLLRADLHILYDADLIGIDPFDFSVHLFPEIKNSYYKRYDGKRLKITRKDFGPSKEALAIRWQRFQAKVNKLK